MFASVRPRQIAALLGLALLPAIAAAFFHPRRAAWVSDEISVAQAARHEVLWIDARTRAEYDQGHVPGAQFLSEATWDESLPAVLDAWTPERTVVVYCSSLSCATSHDVARRLRREVGLENVRILAGGWEAWRAAHP